MNQDLDSLELGRKRILGMFVLEMLKIKEAH